MKDLFPNHQSIISKHDNKFCNYLHFRLERFLKIFPFFFLSFLKEMVARPSGMSGLELVI